MGHKTLCNACGIRWRKNFLTGENKKSSPRKLGDSPETSPQLTDIPNFTLSPSQPFPLPTSKPERKKKSKKKSETESLKILDSPDLNSSLDETKRNRKRKIEYSPSYSPSKKKKQEGIDMWNESNSPTNINNNTSPISHPNSTIESNIIDIPPNFIIEDDYKQLSDEEDGFVSLSTPLAPPLLPKPKAPQSTPKEILTPVPKKKSASSSTPINTNSNVLSPPSDNTTYTKVSSSSSALMASSTKKPSTNKILRGIVVSLDSLIQQQQQTEHKIQNLLFQYPQLQFKADSNEESPLSNPAISSSQLASFKNFQGSISSNLQTLFNVLFIPPNQQE